MSSPLHPGRQNKVDISKLSPQEQQLFSKYGKLPTHKSVLMKMQKERKYFDSGDYALSKAGVAPQSNVGTAIPNPENIPHASASNHGVAVSPTTSTSPMNKEPSPNSNTPSTLQQSADVDMEGANPAAREINVEDPVAPVTISAAATTSIKAATTGQAIASLTISTTTTAATTETEAGK